jgi:hypothetical protein
MFCVLQNRDLRLKGLARKLKHSGVDNCVRLLLPYAYGQHINMLKHFLHV